MFGYDAIDTSTCTSTVRADQTLAPQLQALCWCVCVCVCVCVRACGCLCLRLHLCVYTHTKTIHHPQELTCTFRHQARPSAPT